MISGIVSSLVGMLGHGCEPDAPDPRDRSVVGLLGALAESPPATRYSVRSKLVGPKHQRSSKSCTGQAQAQAFRTSCLAVGIECPDLSALHNYLLGRATWGGQSVDAGSNGRAAMKAAQKWGICSEAAWPFGITRVNKTPPIGAIHDGYHRRLMEGFYRIPSGDVDGIRRVLCRDVAVWAAAKVGKAFKEYDSGVLEKIDREGTGHAFVVEDYLPDESFGILNSWGRSWGMEGRARVSAEWLAKAFDIWAVAVKRPS